MKDLDQCPCSGTTLSKLIQPGILTILARGPLHGYRIVERLTHLRILRGSRPDATGVYRALRAMQKRKLVVSSWDVSEPGPALHLYELTDLGSACLRRWVRTLHEYRESVRQLLGAVKAASAACRCRRPRRGRRAGRSPRARR